MPCSAHDKASPRRSAARYASTTRTYCQDDDRSWASTERVASTSPVSRARVSNVAVVRGDEDSLQGFLERVQRQRTAGLRPRRIQTDAGLPCFVVGDVIHHHLDETIMAEATEIATHVDIGWGSVCGVAIDQERNRDAVLAEASVLAHRTRTRPLGTVVGRHEVNSIPARTVHRRSSPIADHREVPDPALVDVHLGLLERARAGKPRDRRRSVPQHSWGGTYPSAILARSASSIRCWQTFQTGPDRGPRCVPASHLCQRAKAVAPCATESHIFEPRWPL